MHPPSSLVSWQEKFGKVLLRQLPIDSIKPKERIEVYLNSYESKLVTALEYQLPAASLLMGKEKFYHSVAFPYLKKHPPSDWCIETFTRGLAPWLEKEKLSHLHPLLLPVVQIDLAFLNAHYPEERKGCLNDDVQVVETVFPMIEIRQAVLKKEKIPSFEKKKRCFVIYGNEEGKLHSKEIDPFHGRLLHWMAKHSFEEAIEQLVQDRSLPLDSLESVLPAWGAMWGEMRWIDEKRLS